MVKGEVWSVNDYKKHFGIKQVEQKPPAIPIQKPKKEESEKRGYKEKQEMLSVLKRLSEDVVEELQFAKHLKRRFRFDYCIPSKKIYIEYEGIFAGKSRHTTISGYTRDVEKYNLATTLGWKGLRYTAVNYKNLEEDLTILLSI